MKGERHKHEGRKAEAGRMVGRDRTDERQRQDWRKVEAGRMIRMSTEVGSMMR